MISHIISYLDFTFFGDGLPEAVLLEILKYWYVSRRELKSELTKVKLKMACDW